MDEDFQVPYSNRFEEQKFHDIISLILGRDAHRLKFWYSGSSLEVVPDRIPAARVVKEEDGWWDAKRRGYWE